MSQVWVTHEQRGNREYFGEIHLNTDVITNDLNQLQKEFESTLGVSAGSPRIQIIVFASRGSYQNYLRNQIPEALSRRAIYYRNGEISQIYTFRNSMLMTDIRHEFTHALLHEALPFVPLWIDEGVAEFFEEHAKNRGGSQRLRAVRWKSRTGWSPSLTQLEKIPSAAEMTSNDYRDSWAWVHYLLVQDANTRQTFVQYLQTIARGEAPGTFSSWTESRAPTVAKGVGSYFRRFRFSLR